MAREIRRAGVKAVAIDTERGFLSFGLVKQICDEMNGHYLRLEELSAAPIAIVIRENLGHSQELTLND